MKLSVHWIAACPCESYHESAFVSNEYYKIVYLWFDFCIDLIDSIHSPGIWHLLPGKIDVTYSAQAVDDNIVVVVTIFRIMTDILYFYIFYLINKKSKISYSRFSTNKIINNFKQKLRIIKKIKSKAIKKLCHLITISQKSKKPFHIDFSSGSE